MQENQPYDIERGVGRPPLKFKDPTVKTTLRLPKSLLDRAKAAAGEGDAAELMREGIEAEVRRREKLALKAKGTTP